MVVRTQGRSTNTGKRHKAKVALRLWMIAQVNAENGMTHPRHLHPWRFRTKALKPAIAAHWKRVEQRGGSSAGRAL